MMDAEELKKHQPDIWVLYLNWMLPRVSSHLHLMPYHVCNNLNWGNSTYKMWKISRTEFVIQPYLKARIMDWRCNIIPRIAWMSSNILISKKKKKPLV